MNLVFVITLTWEQFLGLVQDAKCLIPVPLKEISPKKIICLEIYQKVDGGVQLALLDSDNISMKDGRYMGLDLTKAVPKLFEFESKNWAQSKLVENSPVKLSGQYI